MFRGAAEAPHEPRRGPAGWTREEIEAWVACERPQDHRWYSTSGTGPRLNAREMETRRAFRREIARLCPEVPDYDALIRDHEREFTAPSCAWHAESSAAEVKAEALRVVAALWHQSLSEPVEGEATA